PVVCTLIAAPRRSLHDALPICGLSVHLNVVLPYFLAYATEKQKQRWLPGLADGSQLAAIAMPEPGAGSDLAGVATTAVRDGDHYVLNGAKTFITGGINADLVVVVARTSSGGDRREGLSLLVVESGTPGFSRGRNLAKLGLKARSEEHTSELQSRENLVCRLLLEKKKKQKEH